jgi:hypothetical protein
MQRIIGYLATAFIGAKIGNEIFRFKNPNSGYKPPPFFSHRLM